MHSFHGTTRQREKRLSVLFSEGNADLSEVCLLTETSASLCQEAPNGGGIRVGRSGNDAN